MESQIFEDICQTFSLGKVKSDPQLLGSEPTRQRWKLGTSQGIFLSHKHRKV